MFFKVIQTLVFNQGTKSNVNVGLPYVMWSAHLSHTYRRKT